MHQIKVIVDEGLNTLTTTKVQSIEDELSLALAMCNYLRTESSKLGDTLEFTYRKRVNGNHPS